MFGAVPVHAMEVKDLPASCHCPSDKAFPVFGEAPSMPANIMANYVGIIFLKIPS